MRDVRRPLLCLAACAALLLAREAWPQPLPSLDEPVNDFAGVIDADSANAMDRVIRALERATGDVIVVATVDTIAPFGDIREYAVKLFENQGRGIGQRGQDNGALVLLAVKDREVRVEVGYGLEPFITDGFAGETSRRFMVPAFRRGAYGEGLLAGVQRLAGRIADARNVTLDEIPAVREPARPPSSLSPGIVTLLFVAFILLSQFAARAAGGSRRRRRRWGRRTWSGWTGGVGPFGGGFGGGFGGLGGGGGFGGFGGGRSGGGGGGASW